MRTFEFSSCCRNTQVVIDRKEQALSIVLGCVQLVSIFER